MPLLLGAETELHRLPRLSASSPCTCNLCGLEAIRISVPAFSCLQLSFIYHLHKLPRPSIRLLIAITHSQFCDARFTPLWRRVLEDTSSVAGRVNTPLPAGQPLHLSRILPTPACGACDWPIPNHRRHLNGKRGRWSLRLRWFARIKMTLAYIRIL
ncbi:hypothetical protein BDW22DRAFT_209533 [Trametopsis cervina]|nr:hypothetical protein BDW22DRAFT_209533 [Trametopsis cervina]